MRSKCYESSGVGTKSTLRGQEGLRRGEFLRGGGKPPIHRLGSAEGSASMLHSMVRGEDPAAKRFSTFWILGLDSLDFGLRQVDE